MQVLYVHDHELCYCWSVSDGQYLASRLSKSINQESAKLKQLILQFNALPANSASTVKLSWKDVTDLSFVHSPDLDVGIPRKIKLSAIKHHHMILRADEEVQLLQTEMKAVVSFFQDDWQKLSSAVEQLKLLPGSKHNNGALHLLQLQRLVCECFLTDLMSTLFQFTNLPPLPVEKFLSSSLSYPHKEDTTKLTVSHDLLQGKVMTVVYGV